ncbi:MAG: response regulator [Deltaproteobacteria bacterium]|nr:response regulator [Deltaproteobacteria bacterium]
MTTQKRVLVTDDDPHMQKFLKTILETEGFIVDIAGNEDETFKKLEQNIPDLLILDYMLPGTNGIEILKELKVSFNSIDVIVITGHGSEKIAVEMMKLGAADYLQKPFGKNDFINTVRRVLSARTAFGASLSDPMILVVDDDKPVLKLIKHALTGLCKIETTTDPREAISMIEKTSYDIILTDYYMPHFDGLELIHKAKILAPSASIVLMTSSTEMDTVRRAMRHGAYDYLNKPFTPEEIRETIAELLIVRSRDTFNNLKHQFELQRSQDAERTEFMLGTVEALIRALEARDAYTSGHSERVTSYALSIANGMKLHKKVIDTLHHSARLHDLGKIGTEDTHLYKKGPLTDSEMQTVSRHPEVGAFILKSVKLMEEYIPGIKHHHERYDGSGYPDGLKGEEIPLIARIICVADALDAMLSSRPYRDGMPLEHALKELEDNKGLQFDPAIVEVATRVITKDKLLLTVN